MTLGELLALQVFHEANVYATEHTLAQEVQSISVLEVYERLPFLKKGELLISSLSGIKNDPERQKQTLSMLKSIGSSGLVICHVGIVMESVSKELIQHARKLDYPLIIVTPHIAFVDILAPVLDQLLHEKNQKLQETVFVLEAFDAATNALHTPEDIVQTLNLLINHDISYIDIHENLISTASSTFEEALIALYRSRKHLLLHHNDSFASIDKESLFFTPIISNGMYYGTLVIHDCVQDHSSHLFNTAVLKAKHYMVNLVLHNINRREYLKHLQQDFIAELLSARSKALELEHKRAENLGLNFIMPAVVVVFDLYRFKSFVVNKPEEDIQKVKENMHLAVKNYLHGKRYILSFFSDKLILIYMDRLPKDGEQQLLPLTKICRSIKKILHDVHHCDVSIGIGSVCHDMTSLARSYDQALQALKLSNRLYQLPSVSTYHEMRFFSFLSELKERELDNSSGMAALVAPLVQQDRETGSDLLNTLKSLLRNNLSTNETAEELFIHRNTVLQRKEKILSLLEHDPFQYPYRMLYELFFIHNRQTEMDFTETL